MLQNFAPELILVALLIGLPLLPGFIRHQTKKSQI